MHTFVLGSGFCHFWKILVPLTYGLKHAAAQQIFLGDRWCLPPPPLAGHSRALSALEGSSVLMDMTDDRHLAALRKFRHRALYGSVVGDPLVKYNTALITAAMPTAEGGPVDGTQHVYLPVGPGNAADANVVASLMQGGEQVPRVRLCSPKRREDQRPAGPCAPSL